MFSPEIMLQPPDGDQWAAIDQLSWPSLDTFDFDGGFVHDANQPDGIKLEERSAISGRCEFFFFEARLLTGHLR
jgi:hypothetical protein